MDFDFGDDPVIPTANAPNNNDSGIIETSNTFRTLAPALEWMTRKSTQSGEHVPFLVIRNEEAVPQLDRIWRSFKIVEVQTFLEEMASGGGGGAKFYHELAPVDCVCNTYAEFDFGAEKFARHAEFGAASAADCVMLLNALLERFVRVMLTHLNSAIKSSAAEDVRSGGGGGGVDDEPLTAANDVVVLSSHKPGKKWSIHVIVSPPVTKESIVWRSTTDCGNFVAKIVAAINDKLLCEAIDMGVYSSNHTLRMLGCAKSDEPTRTLRYEGSADAKDALVRSMVTLVRVNRRRVAPHLVESLFKQQSDDTTPTPTMLLLTSAFIGKFVGDIDQQQQQWRPLTCGNGPVGSVSDLDLLTRRTVGARAGGNTAFATALVSQICAAKQFEKFKPAKTFVVQSTHKVVLPCDGRYCTYNDGEHNKKHKPVYLVLDMIGRRWQQRCHVTACRAAEWQWQHMDDEVGALCLRYLRDECTLCKPVAGLGECLFGGV